MRYDQLHQRLYGQENQRRKTRPKFSELLLKSLMNPLTSQLEESGLRDNSEQI
jgi:hypothetical protein